jgi:UDP-glucose:(heptosyl)LPS alpha-1,3-glucosyltransferase
VRIAIVVERFGPGAGGVERVGYELAAELARRDADVTVVCRRIDVEPTGRLAVRVVRVPSVWQPLRVWAFSRRTAGLCGEFDVVHGLSRTRSQDIFRAGGGSHAAYMEHVYRDPMRRARFSPRHRVILALEEAIFRDPRQLVQCNARGTAREIAARYGVPDERLVTIYNGVDTEALHPRHRTSRGAALRRTLGIEGPVALFAGSGFSRKGLDRAIAGLAAARVPATLLVAGAGDTAPFASLARHGGVERQVRFLGRRRDMADLYAAADLFVLPTRYDPFANACLEAMAAGTPVATTPENGASELIEPGLSGWLGRDDFAPAFALLRDPARLAEMGKAARQCAEGLTWARHTDAVLALYGRAAARRKAMRR